MATSVTGMEQWTPVNKEREHESKLKHVYPYLRSIPLLEEDFEGNIRVI